jgi:hypothetical protein
MRIGKGSDMRNVKTKNARKTKRETLIRIEGNKGQIKIKGIEEKEKKLPLIFCEQKPICRV